MERGYIKRCEDNIDKVIYEDTLRRSISSLIKTLNCLYEKMNNNDFSFSENEEWLFSLYDEEPELIKRAINYLLHQYKKFFPSDLLFETNFCNTLGFRLKIARERKGYSLKDLSSKHIHLFENLIIDIENDKIDPSVRLLNYFSDLYDVSIDWILNGKSECIELPEKEDYWEIRSKIAEGKIQQIKTIID